MAAAQQAQQPTVVGVYDSLVKASKESQMGGDEARALIKEKCKNLSKKTSEFLAAIVVHHCTLKQLNLGTFLEAKGKLGAVLRASKLPDDLALIIAQLF